MFGNMLINLEKILNSFDSNTDFSYLKMASSFLSHSQLSDFQKNGMLVLENFINQNDVKAMKEEINDLVDKMNPREHKGVFSTTSRNQVKISESGNA